MPKLKTVRDLDVSGKQVFVRCDFNVPLSDDGKITDDRRIRQVLPTIRYLLDKDAVVILASHLGRPKGRDPKLTLKPVAQRLSELLGLHVPLIPDSAGPEAEEGAANLQPGSAVLLENVRFHPEEERNDPELASRYARLADIYVNDAFGAAHRAHASTAGIAQLMPAAAGFLMEKEIKFLTEAVDNPSRPFVLILGGAKVKDKIGVVENLLPKVDRLLIGGGMAFTFYKAQGHEVGKSILDEENLEFARKTLGENPARILLAEDVVVAPELSGGVEIQVVPASGIPADLLGADIGPSSRRAFGEAIRGAGTVVWNGPMGVFEIEEFAEGTRAVAKAMAESGATTIVCGGESAAAAQQFGYAGGMTHVSTGGGASLELIEGKKLPGVEALLEE